jgi:hypothetical protein
VGRVVRAPQSSSFAVWFLAGLLLTSGVLGVLFGHALTPSLAPRSFALLAVAGLLVGYGTQLGNGCTSGHGVCGLSRASVRSLVAVLTFMLVAALTVFLTRHVLTSGAPS